ncbi:MAG: response regulator [Planctomycetes bacterium]|nr:response regulator [Planctomycetota bacterium]
MSKDKNSINDFMSKLPQPEVMAFSPDVEEKVRAEFISCTADHIEEIESLVMNQAAGGLAAQLADIRRVLHVIKGDAGFVGLGAVSRLCHELETFLGCENPAGEAGDVLLSAKDYVQRVLAFLSGGVIPAPLTAAEVQPATESAPRRLRILVAEDEAVCRSLISALIKPFGDFEVVEDGKVAWETFKRAHADSKPYDLIFMDIKMPNMDGQEALREIRQWETQHGIALGKGVKIIMTTMFKDPQNVLGAFNSGCEHYLTKPVDGKRLHAALRELGLADCRQDVANA